MVFKFWRLFNDCTNLWHRHFKTPDFMPKFGTTKITRYTVALSNKNLINYLTIFPTFRFSVVIQLWTVFFIFIQVNPFKHLYLLITLMQSIIFSSRRRVIFGLNKLLSSSLCSCVSCCLFCAEIKTYIVRHLLLNACSYRFFTHSWRITGLFVFLYICK